MILSVLIRELEKRGRAQGLSVAEIAGWLGVDRTRFVHIRSGAARLSVESLHELACRFIDDPGMCSLLLGYLVFDVESRRRISKDVVSLLARLDAAASATIRTVVRNLPTLLIAGGGILLIDKHPSRLAAALNAIEAAVRGLGVPVLRERAASGLSRDRRQMLLAAPLVIVEGAGAMREHVGDVLARRADAARLTFAAWCPTSGEAPPAPLRTFRRLRLSPHACGES